MSTTFDLPAAVEEFAKDAADRRSVYDALAHWGAQGRLGELANGLSELSVTVSKSGYVPPAKCAEVERLERAAAADH